MINESHYLRQLGLIHPEKLNVPILIVGAGNIGSWTALALMKLGCQNVTVIDHDHVEEHNVGSQLYSSADIGETKVAAMNKRIGLIAESQPVVQEQQWTPTMPLDDFQIIISAVDNINVRRDLFMALQGSGKIFIDGRMGGNSITVYTIPMQDEEKVKMYAETLFERKDALEVPCSERSVVYNCFIMAGYITNVIAHLANNHPIPPELELDLMNFTLFT